MSTTAIQTLGWSLVHFLWQGALVALALECALFALREGSARLRYTLRCAALGLMGLLPVATYLWLRRGAGAAPALPMGIEEYLAAGEATAGTGLMGWCVGAWALGASLCAARVLRDYARIRRLQSQDAGEPLPADWQVRFERLARHMQVRATVRVIDSVALVAPTVIGWLKPVVLVPARALSGLTTEQLEVVLAHELAHIRRHDYLVNLIQSVLEAVLFYHPAVWWVSNGIRAEREFCCDDAALELSSDGVVYARALATLEGWRNVQPQLGLSTLGGPLMTRIQRLIGIRPSSRPVRGPLAALSALLVIGSATAIAHEPGDAQDPEQLEAMRQHIDEMQQRIDELRAMLDEARGANVVRFGDFDKKDFVVKKGSSEGNVWFFDESGEGVQVEGDLEWTSEDEDAHDAADFVHEIHGAHGENVFVTRGKRAEGVVDIIVDAEAHGDDEGHYVVRIEGTDGKREALTAKIKSFIKEKHKNEWKDGDVRVIKREKSKHHDSDDGHKAKLHEHLEGLHGEHGGEHMEKLHEHLRTLLHDDDGEDAGKLHQHLKELLHREGHGDVEGDANIEVIIKRGDGPAQTIRRRVPLGKTIEIHPEHGSSEDIELFFGDGDSDVRVLELDPDNNVFFGSGEARFEFRTGGDDDGNTFWFDSGDDHQKVRVLELKKRSEELGRQSEEIGKQSEELGRQSAEIMKRSLKLMEEPGDHHSRYLELKRLGEAKKNLQKVELLPSKVRVLPGKFRVLPGRIEVQGVELAPCETEAPCEQKAETKKREIV